MKRHIIFFNGPPRSGKDTAAALLTSRTLGTIVSFAEPLKLQTAALLRVTLEELEQIKDLSHPILDGGTPRQYMINLSEKMIKPCYGKQFFGNVATNKIDNNPNLFSPIVAFSDSGFYDEAIPVVKRYGLVNCTLIRLHRKGTSFDNDSRSHWQMNGLRDFDINNDADFYGLQDSILDYVRQIGFI